MEQSCRGWSLGVSLDDGKAVSEVKWNCLKEAGRPHCSCCFHQRGQNPLGCRQPVSVNPLPKKQITDESFLCCITNKFLIASVFIPLGEEHSLAAQTDNFPFAFSTCESKIGEIWLFLALCSNRISEAVIFRLASSKLSVLYKQVSCWHVIFSSVDHCWMGSKEPKWAQAFLEYLWWSSKFSLVHFLVRSDQTVFSMAETVQDVVPSLKPHP